MQSRYSVVCWQRPIWLFVIFRANLSYNAVIMFILLIDQNDRLNEPDEQSIF